MEITKVTNSIQMIGIEDKDIDLFEGQYVEIGRASCRERVY